MVAISQTVESYNNGISTAPDKSLPPGYVKECINAYPDVTYGLTKRPGTVYTTSLGTSGDLNTNYFFLYRFNNSVDPDNEELYLGRISSGPGEANGTLTIVNEQGGACTINGTADVTNAYLGGANRNEFKVRQRQTQLLILNTTVETAMAATTAPGTLTGTVNTIAELPESPSTGDIYRIVGITGNQDNYVVEWDGDTWTETVVPGALIEIDATTMPYVLQRTATNTFTFTTVDWTDRAVGDTQQLFNPSFIGNTIRNLFYHKTRLGFVSNDNVILGRPRDYYNFFPVTALTVTDADPIDLSATSLKNVELFAVQPLTQGLVLFSGREQFLLTAGTNGVLSPATAAIRSISQYEMRTNIDPILIDDQIYFTTEAGDYTRVLAMQPRGENNSPIFNDVGKPVSTYIPSGMNRSGGSDQNQLYYTFDNRTNDVYFYRFYKVNGQNQLNSWFKWSFPGRVLGMFIQQDKLYYALSANGQVYFCVGYLQTNAADATVTTPEGDVFINPSLDYAQPVLSTSYNSTTGLTTVTVTTVDPDNDAFTPVIVEVDTDDNLENGAFWRLTRVTDTTYTVAQDLSGIAVADLQFGFLYEYHVELPTTYYRTNNSADFIAALTIARMNFAMGRTGAVEFKVRTTGTTDFDTVGEVDISNSYILDQVPIDDERFFTVPIHQRNDNFDIQITSDSPYPVSLLSMSWEGQYSPRYYRRT